MPLDSKLELVFIFFSVHNGSFCWPKYSVVLCGLIFTKAQIWIWSWTILNILWHIDYISSRQIDLTFTDDYIYRSRWRWVLPAWPSSQGKQLNVCWNLCDHPVDCSGLSPADDHRPISCSGCNLQAQQVGTGYIRR